MSGTGHPLPGSDEARHNEIPEHLERDKGKGDDSAKRTQPPGEAVAPDGEPYPAADLGRGPEAKDEEDRPRPGQPSGDNLERDQAEHQDRGQSIAAEESGSD